MSEVATQLMSGDTKQLVTIALTAAVAIATQYFIAKVTKKAEYDSIKENFKQTLVQHEQLTERSGKINHFFNREALAYQIKLSHYEAKSTEAIVACYEKLVSLQYVMMGFLASDNREGEIEGVVDSLMEYRNLVIAKKIWIPTQVLELFIGIQAELQYQVTRYARTLKSLRKTAQTDDKGLDAIHQIQGEFYDYIVELSNRLSSFGDDLAEVIRKTVHARSSSTDEAPPTDSHTPAT